MYGYIFWFEKDIKPYYEDLKNIIESANGRVIKKLNNSLKDKISILVDEKNIKSYYGYKVYNVGLILNGVFR